MNSQGMVGRRIGARGVALSVALTGLLGCSSVHEKGQNSETIGQIQSAIGVNAPPIVVGTHVVDGMIDLFAAGVGDDGKPITERVANSYINDTAIELGDITGDGLDDIILSSGRTYSQTGQETVRPPQYSLLQLFSVGDVMATGDFNGDHIEEVAFGSHIPSDPNGGTIDRIYAIPATPNTATGTAPTDTFFPPGSDLTACDLDNDGRDELIIAPAWEIFTVNGGPTPPGQTLSFVPTLPGYFPGAKPRFTQNHDRITCADVNADGFDDLIVAHADQDVAADRFEVFTHPSKPPISYFIAADVPQFRTGEDIAAGDLDGDNFAEVVVGGVSQGQGIDYYRVLSAPGKTPPPVFYGQTTWNAGLSSAVGIGRHPVSAGTDADNDGLPDVWETKGIDFDGDGCVDYDLKAQNADPFRKDLFIEIDTMDCTVAGGDCPAGDTHNHLTSALQPVIDAFNDAPVVNANGRPNGIALHIAIDERIPHQNEVDDAAAKAIMVAYFGTAAERSQTTSHLLDGVTPCTTTPSLVRQAKALFYRYNLWGHSKLNSPSAAGFTPAFGVGPEVPKHLIIMTLGRDATNPNSTEPMQQITFMHELGHSLGLHHGGSDRFNYKPNYISIMNYAFDVGVPSATGPKLDYSREPLPTLWENQGLSELPGVGGGDPTLSTTYRCPNGDLAWPLSVGSIDWNCNVGLTPPGVKTYPDLSFLLAPGSNTETGVLTDVNGDRFCVDFNETTHVLTTVPGGDDFRMGGYVAPGPNGVVETAVTSFGRQADDVIVAVSVASNPNFPTPDRVLVAGPNDILDTPIPLGVDDVRVSRLTPGANGVFDAVQSKDDAIFFDAMSAKIVLTAMYGPAVAARLAADGTLVAPLLISGKDVDSSLGDDGVVPLLIDPGTNGVLESVTVSTGLHGDDRLIVDNKKERIVPGPDGILSTTITVSDDLVQDIRIVDGKNRECETILGTGDRESDEDGNGNKFRFPASKQHDELKGWNDWANLRFRFRNVGGQALNIGPEPTLAQLEETVRKSSRADLTLAVTASQITISADTPVTYHVGLANLGPMPALSVIVSAALSDKLTVIDCSASSTGTCSKTSASFDSIAPGESVWFEVTARIDCSAPLGSVAQVLVNATATSLDVHPENNTASSTVSVVGTKPRFTVVPPSLVTNKCVGTTLGTAIAQDACGGNVTVTNNAPAHFPLGRTTVTWTASSSTGGNATATQLVDAQLSDDGSCCPVGSTKIVGTSNNDVLTGTSGADCILGLGGQDRINGGGGNDAISGGDGDDIIDGQDGNDKLYGGSGQDSISGSNGDDLIYGGPGDDVCTGGLGIDALHGDPGQDRLTGDDGNDSLFGDQGTDILNGSAGDDYLEGGLAGTTAGTNDQCTGGAGVNLFVSCQTRPDAPNAVDACRDTVSNGFETALNCGGSGCLPCGGDLVCSTGADCSSGICSGGSCKAPPTPLWAALAITSDWGSGYCATLYVTNPSASATSNWSARINTNQSTVTSSWAATFSGNSGSVLITPSVANRAVAPGATNGAVGFCANRSGPSTAMPSVLNRGATF